MKLTTLSLIALGATALVSCKNQNSNNPYDAPAAAVPPASNPYAIPQSNGETGNYSAQQAPYQSLPGVGNTLPPTQAPAVNNNDYQSYLPTQQNAPSAAPVGSTIPHTVQAGDSLWKLSRDNNTTVEAIQAANGLTGTNIMLGQTIQIPNN